MSPPRLKIHLEQTCLLSAVSRSANGALHFDDERHRGTWHGADRRLVSLFGPAEADRVSALEIGESLALRVSLVDRATFSILRRDDGETVLSDDLSRWVPLQEATLEDVLDASGLSRHAEPLNVADPFASPA